MLRRIGSGGMADVYLADQVSLGRQVALKLLPDVLAADSRYVQRFFNEARAAAALVHSNIVQIYEVGRHQGHHFIAQEYVHGKNLGELLQREGALQPRLVLDILRQVVAALAKAAEKSIIHRDIKPENILLSHNGEVKVADFGLARVHDIEGQTLTQVGVTMGTPLYMSPEQIEGRPLDPRSDIYSLGVTSYHLLAGVPPHTGETALAIAVKHLNVAPEALENVRPDVPQGLARVVHRMMAKQPQARYQSASQLLGELLVLAGEGEKEGWSEGPAGWKLAELVSVAGVPNSATAELGRLMQADARLAGSKPPSTRRRRVLIWVGAAVVGMLLALLVRPRFYLEGASPGEVQRRDSAWAQIYHAKTAPSENAWLAVRQYFPEEDEFVLQQSDQGLVRYYLLISQQYRRAIEPLERLARDVDESNEPLYCFTQAALCIAHAQLGNEEEALTAASRLSAEERDILRETDRPIYDLFDDVRLRLQK